jgi:putative phosphoesterase
MRIAVVSDIHANRTAFEAVLADLRETSPDLVFHGGDMADLGSGPVEVLDRIRDLGWPGVVGNTHDMLARPESLETFAESARQMQPLLPAIREMAAWSRDALGPERVAWLRDLPMRQSQEGVVLVHASAASPWRGPGPEAADSDLDAAFGPEMEGIVVYGHIHRSYIRRRGRGLVVNSGSVSLSYDGDPRAAYLLIEDGIPEIRRVAYDLDREIDAIQGSGLPHADWIIRILRSASPQMP